MRVALHRADLAYGDGLTLFTAASGKVATLDELYLHLVDDGVEGIGAVRLNIAYLNGLDPEAVVADALAAAAALDWSADPEALLAAAPWADRLAPTRMLLDGALHDLAARRAGTSVAARLGGPAGARVSSRTNQTLFHGSLDDLLARADRYVARGFHDLKVRLGVGSFDDDCARLQALRDRFGATVTLAADVNGAWSPEAAAGRLDALAVFDLAYVEQPVAPGPMADLLRIADGAPMPIMLDESVAGAADVEAVAAARGRLLAHLKLVKLGGIGPTVAAARRLRAAGVPFMIGQMNEGGAATAAALHAAAATGPAFAELYGADGIVDDPAPGVAYADGRVSVAGPLGLGVAFDPTRTRPIREIRP